MDKPPRSHRIAKPLRFSILLIVSIVVVIGGGYFTHSRYNIVPNMFTNIVDALSQKEQFPAIDTASLSPTQAKIVTNLKTEYEQQPDQTKYSEGVREPWCADFVSWIMRESGVPLSNPNSGSWRIPGTYTLRDYYKASGRFKPYSSAYQPKVGDVILYDNPGSFGQHTNIVIKNDNGKVTTVGGNERGGIRVNTNTAPQSSGIVGYGIL